jgi:hypothetical protein
MAPALPRLSILLGAILVLGACGTTASPSATAETSPTPKPASHPPDVLAVVCAAMPKPFDPNNINLTGAWAGDDGGIYYLRQLGSVVWWNGMSERDASPLNLGRDWNNVGRGVMDGTQIVVEWSDVPRAESAGNGTLTLNVEDDGTGNVQIVKVREEGENGIGFGAAVWTPCLPVELQVADYVQTYGGDVHQYADILTFQTCNRLADLKAEVTSKMNTQEAGSPEFRASLGYSNAISERQLALDC